jgi:hypothetical protein
MATVTKHRRLTKPDPTAAAKTLTYNTNLDRVEAGFTVQGLAGESISQFQAVFYNAATNRWLKATDTSLGARGIAATGAASGATIYVYQEPFSVVTNTGWAWTAGQMIYVSTTAGTLTATPPTAASRPIGIAISATEIMLHEPSANRFFGRLVARHSVENTSVSEAVLILESPDGGGLGQVAIRFVAQSAERARVRATESGQLVLSSMGGDLYLDQDNSNPGSLIRAARTIIPEVSSTYDLGASWAPWRSLFTRRDDGGEQHILEAQSDTVANSPIMLYRRSRAGPTAVLAGDRLIAWVIHGYNGSAFATAGNNAFFATENWTATANGSRFQVNITRDGTAGIIGEAFGVRTPANDETALMIARNLGGTITTQRVSMGAADSGGTGFRLLRVSN